MVQRLANASKDVDTLVQVSNRHDVHAPKSLRATFCGKLAALAERLQVLFQHDISAFSSSLMKLLEIPLCLCRVMLLIVK